MPYPEAAKKIGEAAGKMPEKEIGESIGKGFPKGKKISEEEKKQWEEKQNKIASEKPKYVYKKTEEGKVEKVVENGANAKKKTVDEELKAEPKASDFGNNIVAHGEAVAKWEEGLSPAAQTERKARKQAEAGVNTPLTKGRPLNKYDNPDNY